MHSRRSWHRTQREPRVPRCEELRASFGEESSPSADPGVETQFGTLSEVLSGTKEKAEIKLPVHQGMLSLVGRCTVITSCVIYLLLIRLFS